MAQLLLEKRNIGLVLALFSFMASVIVLPAYAGKADIKLETKGEKPVDANLVRFATLPEGAKDLVVIAESSRVEIEKVAGTGQISVYSNCPRNWNVSGNVVRQAGFCQPRKGTAMMGDALGSRAIVNGRIYILPNGKMQGLKMGPNGVFINDEPLTPLAGSDVPGSCSGSDIIHVRVPESFNGAMNIACAGESEVVIDSWKGGDLACTLLQKSGLQAGHLEALNKYVVDNRGMGKALVDFLSAKVFVANVTGAGQVNIKKGTAEVSNATVSGTGNITLKGTFKNLSKSIEGKGTIEILQ